MVRKSMNASRQREIEEFRKGIRAIDEAVGGQGDGQGDECQTCAGTGRLKHPQTGKPSKTCPECEGTGVLTPDGAPAEDRAGRRYARHVRFEHGDVYEMQGRVLNSAHHPAVDAAWARLEATARAFGWIR